MFNILCFDHTKIGPAEYEVVAVATNVYETINSTIIFFKIQIFPKYYNASRGHFP